MMKINKKLFIPIVLFILSISLCFADETYSETGNYNSYFQQGFGFFNDVEMQTSDDYNSYAKTITTQRQTPLVADLDGDEINEIIILDGNTLRLFNDKELNIVDSFSVSNISGLPYILSYDIDNDGYTEIMVVSSHSDALDILEYNGTDFYIQKSLSLADVGGHEDGEVIIKCMDTNKCIAVYTEYEYADGEGGGGNTQQTYAVAFNSTDLGQRGLIEQSAGFTIHCFPKIPVIAIADYDNDGTDEFIVSFGQFKDGGGNDELFIGYIFINSSFGAELENEIEENGIYEAYTSGAGHFRCEDANYNRIFTSPLVFDIDGSSSNGLETVVGFMIDSDEFKMHSYKSDMGFLDDYPEVFQADGILISNVLRANAFTGNPDDEEFCVMGYDDAGEEIDLLCASEQTHWDWLFINYESVEFIYDVSGMYNVTDDYGNYNVISHSAQHSTTTTDNINLNEIVNSYGVLELDWNTNCRAELPPIKCMNLIFENPVGDSVLISVDAEKTGRDDLIALTSTNLWYIDDKYSNSDGYISYYYVNPCLDATWKINTSLEVRMIVNNEDILEDTEDKVSAKAILYYGDDNEQDSGWSANVTAGTTLTFPNLKINETISTATLRLIGRDAFNPANIDIIDLTFSVGTTGVEFGDCSTEVDLLAPEEDIILPSECSYDDDCPNGYVCIDGECITVESSLPVLAMQEASGIFHIGITALWLMFMLALLIAIWFAPVALKSNFFDSANARLGAIFLGESIMLIMGVVFGFIPLAILITIIILGLIGFSIWTVKKFTGTPQ